MNQQYQLPESWVAEGMEKAQHGVIFGVPITELSRDELIASVAMLGYRQVMLAESHAKDLQVLSSYRLRSLL